MAKEIKNRRENILINEIPPEILDEATLSEDGFVKNTDYASGQTGGVIRVSAGNGSAVSSGILVGAVRSLDQYGSANVNTFICKGTLENVKTDVTARALVDIATAQITEPIAGTYTVKLTYDGAAWGVTIIQDT